MVVINSGDEEMDADIAAWRAEVPMDCTMQQIMVTNELGYSILPVERRVEDGMLHLHLKPYTGVVLRHQQKAGFLESFFHVHREKRD